MNKMASIVLFIVFTILPLSSSHSFTITQLTNNSYNDIYPQINNSGQIVWQGHNGTTEEIFFYNGTSTVQLTSNSDDDLLPLLNESGQVVWRGWYESHSEIYLYNGTTTIQLTDSSDWLNSDPQINNSGQVVWHGCIYGHDCEIFLYNGTTTIPLTDNSYEDYAPQINNSGQVVWHGLDGGSDYEIYLYNGPTTVQLTNNAYSDTEPQINNSGQVVWQQWDGSDYEIYLYDGTFPIQLTNNTYNDTFPLLNESGQVVWRGWDESHSEIYLYNGTTTIQLTDSSDWLNSDPQINNSGQVVWHGCIYGHDCEIFLYDGTTTMQLTDNYYDDKHPQINNSGQVVWDGDIDDTEIFLYTPDAAGPIPDIKANGSDGPITVSLESPLTLTVQLDAGGMMGQNADWWAGVDIGGWYHYDLFAFSWTPSIIPTYQGPLFNLNPFDIPGMTGLSEGTYTFYFAVDTGMNSVLDMDRIYFDSVQVTVAPSVSEPYNIAEDFPLEQGDNWTYHNNETHLISGTETVNGVDATKFLINTEKGDDYMLLDISSGALRFHKIVGFDDIEGCGWSQIVFTPPANMIPAELSIGEKHTSSTTANYSDCSGVEGTQTITIEVTFEAVEDVIVPAGTFDNCLRFKIVTSNLDQGEEDNSEQIWWLAKGVGLVKSIENGHIEELTSATVGGISYP